MEPKSIKFETFDFKIKNKVSSRLMSPVRENFKTKWTVLKPQLSVKFDGVSKKPTCKAQALQVNMTTSQCSDENAYGNTPKIQVVSTIEMNGQDPFKQMQEMSITN